jgi:hypothetical protein
MPIRKDIFKDISVSPIFERKPYRYSDNLLREFVECAKEFKEQNGGFPKVEVKDLQEIFGKPKNPNYVIPLQAYLRLKKEYGVVLKKIRGTEYCEVIF